MTRQERRKRLAGLSFSEKGKILEKLRRRSLAIAASGLRRRSAGGVRHAAQGSRPAYVRPCIKGVRQTCSCHRRGLFRPPVRYWVNGEDESYEREGERVSRFGGSPPPPVSPSDVAGGAVLVCTQPVLFTFVIVAFVLSLK